MYIRHTLSYKFTNNDIHASSDNLLRRLIPDVKFMNINTKGLTVTGANNV